MATVIDRALAKAPVRLWTNREVPPNDEGISLGQAAMAVPGIGKG